jgi:predicted membrane protein
MSDKENFNRNEVVSKSNSGEKIGFGILLVIAGLLFALKNLDMLPENFEDILISWQMLLIGIGLVKFVFDSSKFVASILILVGLFFILPEIYDFSIDFVDVFWPALLIIAGIMLIFRSRRNKSPKFNFNKSEFSSDSFINEVNIFGGSEKVIESQDFKGGNINNVFGGSSIDLRGCKIVGESASIEVNCVFGGVEIYVPEEWDVVIKVNSIFGGFDNKRMKRQKTSEVDRKTLYISGSAVFGGGEIK